MKRFFSEKSQLGILVFLGLILGLMNCQKKVELEPLELENNEQTTTQNSGAGPSHQAAFPQVAVEKNKINTFRQDFLNKQNTYQIVSDQSKVLFKIDKYTQPARGEASPIQGEFVKGLSGRISFQNPQESKIELNILSLNSANDLRDKNIVEAFFAARPSHVDTKAVDAVWEKIVPVLVRGVSSAQFLPQTLFVKEMENVVEVEGTFLLWKRAKMFKSFNLVIQNENDGIHLKSQNAVELNLPTMLGENIHQLLMKSFLAAKCPHQDPAYADVVNLSFDIVLKKEG